MKHIMVKGAQWSKENIHFLVERKEKKNKKKMRLKHTPNDLKTSCILKVPPSPKVPQSTIKL